MFRLLHSCSRWFAAAAALLCLTVSLPAQRVAGSSSSVTVPMKVENNRIFVPVTVTGPTGQHEEVLFWVDTGGDIVMLSGRVARDLKLKPTGKTIDGMGEHPAQVLSGARLSVAGMDLMVDGSGMAAQLAPASRTVAAGIDADGFLPARVLKQYDVVFDYPAHTFTLGLPGSLQHRGLKVPLGVEPHSGFARIEATLGGAKYGFMLDTGAAYSGMSARLLAELSVAHPAWPHQVGAVGAANMVGKQFDVTNRMLTVPRLELGAFEVRHTGFVSRPAGVYETYISKDMSSPIVGVLAGNVLRQFRVEIDYANSTAYLESSDSAPKQSLDCVGLILRVRESGMVEISGSIQRDGLAEVPGVQPGDRLLEVDEEAVTGDSLAAILERLSGQPGEVRVLTVSRRGRMLRLPAIVRGHLMTR